MWLLVAYMARRTRRRVLQASAGIIIGSIAGCTSLGSPSEDSDQTPTATPTPSNTPPSNDPPSASIYISEVRPNPEGSDDSNLNGETVLVEMKDDRPTDISGYSLVYSQRHTYEFPDNVSDVESGSTIEIHSGDGEFGVDASAPPEYNLFVGRTNPLLSNEGMELELQNSDGEVIDSMEYPSLGPGERYVRPE